MQNRKMVHTKVSVPHEDFLDFMDALKILHSNQKEETVIIVSSDIYYKLTSGGKWVNRNLTNEGKPILEFEWLSGGWHILRTFRGVYRPTSVYADTTKVYWVQFDDEPSIEIAAE